MSQMKEHIKSPEKELNKMEISNLSDVEFKALVVKMLKKISEALSSIKKSSQKQRIPETKNNLQGTTVECIKSRIK